MTAHIRSNNYPPIPDVKRGELPDPFADPAGGRITTRPEWPALARAWRDMIIDLEYGGFPPKPESVKVEELSHNRISSLPGTPCNWSYRIHCSGGERAFSFCVRIIFPRTSDPIPAIIDGDGCWWKIYRETGTAL